MALHPSQNFKILIIDDEVHIAEGLRLNLNLRGHDVLVRHNGKDGLDAIDLFAPDLIVVDLMMPEIDGENVIKRVRAFNQKIPILVISAKDQVSEKIKCLELGVDDYLAKPFHLDEFLLRIDRMLLRLSWLPTDLKSNESEKEWLIFGDNKVDAHHLKAYTKNGVFDLTLQELKLLEYFFIHKNRVIKREDILKDVLGYDPSSQTRTLDNFIVRFRRYFEDDPKRPEYFKSVRSIGYIFIPSSNHI